jgi:hypothetical protein
MQYALRTVIMSGIAKYGIAVETHGRASQPSIAKTPEGVQYG